ncbi:MAG: DNA photolyase family protein [Salinisphaera sp.]|nr:DNA photolyase family protein [Salinisphaera sp.]
MKQTAIVWFRRDLRLADNPALTAALESGFDAILPVFIHAPAELEPWAPGGAQRVWLHCSLAALDQELRAAGSRLVIRRGPTHAALNKLIRESGATAVYWNRLYEPQVIARDKRITKALKQDGIQTASFNAALLHEPWELITAKGEPYKVFAPYWNKARYMGVAAPAAAPTSLPAAAPRIASMATGDLRLLPRLCWDRGIRATWTPGERGAHERLETFVADVLSGYAEARDRPGVRGTSGLSPHLHFGEIGPRQIVHRVDQWLYDNHSESCRQQVDRFRCELGWREFAHQLLYHFPDTPEQPLDSRFSAFPWADPAARGRERLQRWKNGRTGVPMIDAGMRELWQTGFMHNRLRMTVASFLTKNLHLPWQVGARWFWDTLVDADLANNTLGWQWVAGCGADAAPFFRVFNPARQGERFDPHGDYVRRWVPKLADLPSKYLHRPWDAPPSTLKAAGVKLGRDYPEPLVDLKVSRREALDAFQQMKNRRTGK